METGRPRLDPIDRPRTNLSGIAAKSKAKLRKKCLHVLTISKFARQTHRETTSKAKKPQHDGWGFQTLWPTSEPIEGFQRSAPV
jgi:hypothetical protein